VKVFRELGFNSVKNKKSTDTRHRPNGKWIVISNLDSTTTAFEVRRLIKDKASDQADGIANIDLVQIGDLAAGTAFVEFKTAEGASGAAEAMNGRKFKRANLIVHVYTDRLEITKEVSERRRRTVVISGLPAGVDYLTVAGALKRKVMFSSLFTAPTIVDKKVTLHAFVEVKDGSAIDEAVKTIAGIQFWGKQITAHRL